MREVERIYIHIDNKKNKKGGVFIFVDNLRVFMNMRGLTGYDVAQMSGVSKSYIYDLMSGKRSNPSITKVEQIAAALGVNVLDLMD